jgi:hypothetical protein
MIRRRVIGGQVFILTRRGWRLVLNGYIRTRKGWRKMRRRPGRRRQPAAAPVIEKLMPATLPSRRQWCGKYNALQEGKGADPNE